MLDASGALEGAIDALQYGENRCRTGEDQYTPNSEGIHSSKTSRPIRSLRANGRQEEKVLKIKTTVALLVVVLLSLSVNFMRSD